MSSTVRVSRSGLRQHQSVYKDENQVSIDPLLIVAADEKRVDDKRTVLASLVAVVIVAAAVAVAVAAVAAAGAWAEGGSANW